MVQYMMQPLCSPIHPTTTLERQWLRIKAARPQCKAIGI